MDLFSEHTEASVVGLIAYMANTHGFNMPAICRDRGSSLLSPSPECVVCRADTTDSSCFYRDIASLVGFDTFMYMKLINCIRASVKSEGGPNVLSKIEDGSFWTAFDAQAAGDNLLKVTQCCALSCFLCFLSSMMIVP